MKKEACVTTVSPELDKVIDTWQVTNKWLLNECHF